MLYRVATLPVANIAVIYGGTNDRQYDTTVQASPTPTSTVFAVGAGKGDFYLPGTHLLVGAESALISSVSTDTITLAAPLSGGAPAAGTAVVLDTQTNLTAVGNAIRAAGCTRIVYGLMHYYNYSSGGDTHSTPLASNVTMRALQSAAAAAVTGAVTCNFWNWMDNLIQTGAAVQGSYSWHVLDSNIHLNANGEMIIAQALYATIAAQTGWLAALS
jgi:lysophospholipase L1-like esterase